MFRHLSCIRHFTGVDRNIEAVSSSCRQPETSVSYAAVDSSSITQKGREETVEQESGKKVEAVPKDADETTVFRGKSVARRGNSIVTASRRSIANR